MVGNFGIDIGGTTVKIGYFVNDTLVDKFSIPTNRENNGSNIIKDIADTIKLYLCQNNIDVEQITGYGIGVPGTIVNNVATLSGNLGWVDYNVKDEFRKYINSNNIVIANDANAAAAGEYWALRNDVKNLVMITFGTGIGCGVIINGKVVEGVSGSAGELGHVPVVLENGEQCGCGNTGCLETVASAAGIVNEAKKALSNETRESVLRSISNLSAKEVFDAARDGDKLANELVEQLGKYVGVVFTIVAATVDPNVFIVGGGVSAAGDIFVNIIEKYYKRYALKSLKNVKFRIAKLGNDAGIYGAAYLVKNASNIQS